MFYVYILESLKDGTYYIGQTEDLPTRLDFHNKGLSKYTGKKLPWKIIYFEEYKTRKEAIVRERFLKEQRNREFYKKLINNWSGSSVGYPEHSGLPVTTPKKSKDAN